MTRPGPIRFVPTLMRCAFFLCDRYTDEIFLWFADKHPQTPGKYSEKKCIVVYFENPSKFSRIWTNLRVTVKKHFWASAALNFYAKFYAKKISVPRDSRRITILGLFHIPLILRTKEHKIDQVAENTLRRWNILLVQTPDIFWSDKYRSSPCHFCANSRTATSQRLHADSERKESKLLKQFLKTTTTYFVYEAILQQFFS